MKPFKETSDLVALLESRGLEIDRPDGADFLHDVNYYRFTGYSRQFQRNPGSGDNTYDAGSRLTDICTIIDLDAELRRLIGMALTVVELSVRARFAHEAGRHFGEGSFYLDAENYHAAAPGLDAFLNRMRVDMSRSKSPTVARYTRDGNDERVPIWVAVEVLSFGAIAKMMTYLVDDLPVRQVASSYSLAWEGFQSTIHSFSVLRNQCAHHGQIWNRRPGIHTPVLKKLRPRGIDYDYQGSFPAIIMLKHYLKAIRPSDTWAVKIDQLLDQNPLLRAGVLKPFAK